MKTTQESNGRIGRIQVLRGKVLVDRYVRTEKRALTGLAGSAVLDVATGARRTEEKRERDVDAQIARMVSAIFGSARATDAVNGQRYVYRA